MGSTPPTGGDQRGGISEIPASLRFIGKAGLEKEQLTSFFETYPLPVWVFHQETLAFLAMNSAAIRHLGYTEEEFLQLTLKDIYAAGEVADFVRSLHFSFIGFLRVGVWRHFKKDGQTVDDEITCASLVVDGQPCCLVVVMDVTERRWAEALLQNINSETERRLEARTLELEASAGETESFVETVTRDEESPLRRLQRYSEELARELPDSEQRAKELNRKIEETAGKIAELATNLLRLSRLTYEPVNLQPLNLSQMVGRILQKLQEIEPDREVQVEILPNVQAWADPVLLQLLLENLVQNAWKFTRQNSNSRIEFNGEAEQGEMVCSIRDNGVGFESGLSEELFEPFRRFHPHFDGLGIGLSLVKRIIAKHGGRVWAESRPGQGAAFCFTLPIPPGEGSRMA